eukprot:14102-Heterococcus_DN1.PRE.2
MILRLLESSEIRNVPRVPASKGLPDGVKYGVAPCIGSMCTSIVANQRHCFLLAHSNRTRMLLTVGSGRVSRIVTEQPLSHSAFAAPQPLHPPPMMATFGLRSDTAYSCNVQGKQSITHYRVSLASFVQRLKQLQALLAASLTLELIDVVSFLSCSPRALGVETIGANTNDKARHGANSSSSSHMLWILRRNDWASHRPDSDCFSEQWQ